MERLKNFGLTPESINKISEKEFKKLIFEASFNNTKAKNIKQVAKIIMEEHAG